MAAARYYEEARPGLGRSFLDQLDATLERIERQPLIAQPVVGTVRRSVLSRFPYIVLYRAEPTAVQVLGVLPTRADPAHLLSRADTKRAQ